MKRNQRSPVDDSARQGQMKGRGRSDMRLAIAHVAAKLIAEGQTDYHAAKQKAARQLGVTHSHALPDDHEIELALRERFTLFAKDSQQMALCALRQTALMLMERLDKFSPWLVGSVLAGTANEFSEIELELVDVEAKDFEMYLLNAGVEFQLSHERLDREAIIYNLEYAGAPVSITLYEHHAARQAAHPCQSIKHDRVDKVGALTRFQAKT